MVLSHAEYGFGTLSGLYSRLAHIGTRSSVNHAVSSSVESPTELDDSGSLVCDMLTTPRERAIGGAIRVWGCSAKRDNVLGETGTLARGGKTDRHQIRESRIC